MRAAALATSLGLGVIPLREGPSRYDAVGALTVMREDHNAIVLGGNKVRKLEWLLGAAQTGGDVLTLGPAGGHHLLASAVYARRHGFRLHAVAWPQPHTPRAERHLRALHAHAEHIWPSPSRRAAVAVFARAWATIRVAAGYPPTAWGPGGSDPLGTLGWVQAGLEIAEAVAEGRLNRPPRVWVPSGSGGTAAGLWLGLALGGLVVELHAVDITGFGEPLIRAQALRARRMLANRGVAIPVLGPLTVVREASAYGVPTAPGEAAAAWAHGSGIEVDATYSGKALAHARTSGPGLFIATANGRPLDPLSASGLTTLPARLAGLLAPR